MSVLVRCPNPQCSRSYRVNAEHLGKRFKCQACHTQFAATAAANERAAGPLAGEAIGPQGPANTQTIGSLLDELTDADIHRANASPTVSTALKASENELLQSHMPKSIPVQRNSGSGNAGRSMLAAPSFIMFFVCLIIAAVSGAFAIVSRFFFRTFFLARFATSSDDSDAMGGMALIWMISVGVFLGGLAAAVFWYWLGETIRLGRAARLSDIFTEDELYQASVGAEHADRHVPVAGLVAAGVTMSVVLLGFSAYIIFSVVYHFLSH
jgi:hypothetical protein